MVRNWQRWIGMFLMLGTIITLSTGGCLDIGNKTDNPPTTTTGDSRNYSVSGTVVLSGVGFAPGVTITLSGASNQTATTNDSGNYTVTNLPNGNYIVTPSKTGYSFSPGSMALSINGSSWSGINFTASTSSGGTTYSITGRVSGAGDVTVALSGASIATTMVDSNGDYTFTGLSNGNYTVTPSKAGYSFNPATLSVRVNSANVTGQDFTATAYSGATYNISGQVTGAGASDIMVTLNGPAYRTTIADASGNYTIYGLQNGNYTVTPSKSGYTFSPASNGVYVNGADITGRNFAGTAATGSTYSVSGQVTGVSTPVVIMRLSGANFGEVATDSDGNYMFTGLANGTYTLTPDKPDYVFNPGSRAFTISGSNWSSVNFTGSASGGGTTYSIAGRVATSSTAGVSGVSLILSGPSMGTTMSDADGYYSFQNLQNGTYQVTASNSGYTFNPGNLSVYINNANVTGRNFTANTYQGTTYSISGQVTGAGTTDVLVTLNGPAYRTTMADTTGNYTFTGLQMGTYFVTPEKTGYYFSPASLQVTISINNVPNTNFTATVVSSGYSIWGYVDGALVSNVTVNLSGTAARSTVTDYWGYYEFAGLQNGSYTVSPALTDYRIDPPNRTVNINNMDFYVDTFMVSGTYSISGTVSYTGSKTGRVYVNVLWAGSGSGDTSWGTSIAAPGAFTIRGVQPGEYILSAWLDNLGNGAGNASNPKGNSSLVTVGTTNATGVTVTLTDPASLAPPVMTVVMAIPSNESVMIFWGAPTISETDETEVAESYNIYWDTTSSVSKTSANKFSVPAQGDMGIFVHSGLTDGTAYYYVLTSVVNGVESAESQVIPATPNAPTGSNTVSGTVTFPGSAAGKNMFVGVFAEDKDSPSITYTLIASPVSPQAYSIAGVGNGTYYAFATIDLNSNGVIDAGDLENTEGEGTMVAVNSADVTSNIVLTDANVTARVQTGHYLSGSNHNYNLDMRVSDGKKRVVKTVLVGGPNIVGPVDIAKRWGFEVWFGLDTIRPSVGDTYTFEVTYSDATTETLTAAVTAVLDAFATNLSVTSGLMPTFSWAAPTTPPLNYTYEIQVDEEINMGNWTMMNRVWEYPKDGEMPSTQTSVDYNFDNGIEKALEVGKTYRWSLRVKDLNRNSAEVSNTFTR